jgi:Polyketide cyclase / dehydrase and lipid transport
MSMSVARRQAVISAPLSRVWELVGDPRRHPEWWPRVVEVRGERFDQGAEYAQVTKSPGGGKVETMFLVESRDELREIKMRCTQTGMYARWLLTEAQRDTFVEVEFGMDPAAIGPRMFDMALGRLYFRRWLEQSLDALETAAAPAATPDRY